MDLSTTYLGLTLENPLVAGASPLSRTLDGLRALEDAGAGAVVMFSLFEEQVDAPERGHARRLGALRPTDRGCRRGRPRIEPITPCP